MPGQGQRQLAARNTPAIVTDGDPVQPTAVEFHLDQPRPGVQAVLDQFIDHRRGPLDDLARGDLLGDPGVEDVDAHENSVIGLRELYNRGWVFPRRCV